MLGAAERSFFIWAKTPLLHAQKRNRARRRELECDHALEAESGVVMREVPCVG